MRALTSQDKRNHRSTKPLNKTLPEFSENETIISPFLCTSALLVTAATVDVTQKLFNPDVEAELLGFMANVAFYFTGFVSPSKSMLRLFSVVGRILVIFADYLPDHSMHYEELAIQLVLLGIAMRDMQFRNYTNTDNP
jgi:hypothetical protein